MSYQNTKLVSIAGDASFRKFYRYTSNNKTKIIVKANKEKYKNLIIYATINKFLKKNKILTPSLINLDYKKGIIEIEDFGDLTFNKVLKKNKFKIKIYKKIIDLLLKIQKIKPPKKIKTILGHDYKLKYYSLKNLHKESDLFFQWYLPLVTNQKKIKKEKRKIKALLNNYYKKIFFKNNFFVHRDFHVLNLISHNKKIGLVDTQDALIGNPAYDLVSLIDDVRIKTSPLLKKKIFDYYINKSSLIFQTKYEKFLNDFNILSIQRSLKIIGIFSRLYKRDKKNKYLKLIPYTWSLLENRMNNKEFKHLRLALIEIVPQIKRKKIKFK